MAVILRYFAEIWTYLGVDRVTVVEVRPIISATLPKNVVFGNRPRPMTYDEIFRDY